MVTLLALFAVEPAADEAFLAGWDGTPAGGPRRLHRALRPDVAFRFAAIAPDDAPAPPSAAESARYEVVHEDGELAGPGAVLINPFEVPEDADEAFLAGWHRLRVGLAEQRGYLGTRLFRAVSPARFRFVNVARWSSPLMFARAVGRPDWREAAASAVPFPSHPALYQVVRE